MCIMQGWVLCSVNVYLIEFVYCVVQIYSLFFLFLFLFIFFFSFKSIFLLIFHLLVPSITERGIWIFHSMSVDVTASPCSSVDFYFMHLEIMLRGSYKFKIIISFLWIEHFINMNWNSLSLEMLLAFNFLFLQITEWQILAR